MRDNDTVSEINLGMPEVAASPFLRKQTRRIMVGDVPVGGGARVSVQSMTTTKTHDIGATLQQIAELTAAGCDIVRVAFRRIRTRTRCRSSPSSRASR